MQLLVVHTEQPSSCPVSEKIKHGECEFVATLIIKIIFGIDCDIGLTSSCNNSSSRSSNSNSNSNSNSDDDDDSGSSNINKPKTPRKYTTKRSNKQSNKQSTD